jgi:hypothetical protein
MPLQAGNLPTASDGTRSAGGYAPGTGVVPAQMGTVSTDSNANAGGQVSAPYMVQNAAGTATIGAHAQVDGFKASYAASVTGLVVAASATDIFTIIGSATKTVRITRLRISGIKTTAGAAVDIQLIKRSTADTGGTSTAPTIVPYDSANAAATAVVAAYTANPTLGTAVGTLIVDSIFVPLATASGTAMDYIFGNRPSQAIVLRGVAQQLAVNLNGVTVGGGAFDIWCEFSEE